MWAASRDDVHKKKGGIRQRQKSPQSNDLIGRLFQGRNAIGNFG